jgi:hypothetical protein
MALSNDVKNKIKEINRNPFNEKLIHRYYLEKIYGLFDGSISKRELFPKKYWNKINKINFIIPEELAGNKPYRADFSIYFKNEKEIVPVEIKWLSNELTKQNQINYILENKGFLVAFNGEPPKRFLLNDNYIKLDNEDFRNWLNVRVSELWNDTYASRLKSSVGNNNWLVVLKGKEAIDHFDKMLNVSANKKKGAKKAFWAFKSRNNKIMMKSLLNLKVGDTIYFIIIKVLGGYTDIPLKKDWEFNILNYYKTKIKNPYYIAIKGLKTYFFEKNEKVKDYEKQWPHFIDLEIESPIYNENNKVIKSKNIKFLRGKISESHNFGTVPVQLSLNEETELWKIIKTDIYR